MNADIGISEAELTMAPVTHARLLLQYCGGAVRFAHEAGERNTRAT